MKLIKQVLIALTLFGFCAPFPVYSKDYKQQENEAIRKLRDRFQKAEVSQAATAQYPLNEKITEDVKCTFIGIVSDKGQPGEVVHISCPSKKFMDSVEAVFHASKFTSATVDGHALTSVIPGRVVFHADKSPALLEQHMLNFNDVTSPEDLNMADPDYTDLDEAHYTQDPVILSLVVDSKGKPHGVAVVQSVNSMVDKIAVDALSRSEFTPATYDNKPVPYFFMMGFHLGKMKKH